ncbi:MAG: response regulator [Bacteroidales bacterium]
MKKDILLVEDNLLNQKLVITILKKAEYSFDIAQNGLEAVKKASQKRYRMILMDIQMPHMDGLQATRHIRKYECINGINPTPIYAVTAYTEDYDVERFFEAGINDFIRKPFTFRQLIDFIKKD